MKTNGNTRSRWGRRGARAAAGLLAVAAVLAAPTGPTLAAGRCVHAEVPWTMSLPDGSTHSPGTLRLCLQRELVPGTGLHRVEVDGNPLGLFRSRVRASEGGPAPNPVVIFRVTGEGPLRLVGYAWPVDDHMEIYGLYDPIAGAPRLAAVPLWRDLRGPSDYQLVAARARR